MLRMEKEVNVRDEAGETKNQGDENYQRFMASLSTDTASLQSLLMHNLITNQQHKIELNDMKEKIRDLDDEVEYHIGRKEELKEEVEDLKESNTEMKDQIESM